MMKPGRIGNYELLEIIGQGGMGVVYKARDTRLGRDVAVKMLPRGFTGTDEDRSRFLREAQAAATLNHPHVCTIHDVLEAPLNEENGTSLCLVMELLDGKNLRELMGSLTHREKTDIAAGIAAGIAAAHDKGIVHRDIKPENIMVRRDGRPVVMDFGLARSKGSETRFTDPGSIAGTAGYMSPEQLLGRDADHRSDIFSLGVVLYELFAGKSPFRGEHTAALAYEIVNADPMPLSEAAPGLDPALAGIIMDCLEKNPEDRFQSAAELSRSIQRTKTDRTSRSPGSMQGSDNVGKKRIGPGAASVVSTSDPENPHSGARPAPSLTRVAYIVPVSLILIALGMAAALWLLMPDAGTNNRIVAYMQAAPDTRFHYLGPTAGPVAISPDGRHMVWTGIDERGESALWIRALDAFEARRVPGSADAMAPFWSADSREIGFFSGGRMYAISRAGGQIRELAPVWIGFGGSWNRDGKILYSDGPLNSIKLTDANGSEPVHVTKVDTAAGEFGHRWPKFLPDGRHFLYLVNGSDTDGIYIGSIDSDKKKRLFNNLTQAVYASGYILFVNENVLYARPFDESRRVFTGDPIAIVEQVAEFTRALSYAAFSVSDNGILAFHRGGEVGGGQLTVRNRDGELTGTIGDSKPYGDLAMSNDGRMLAVNVLDPTRRTNDIWWIDIGRNTANRLTFDTPLHRNPVWSPDGNYVAYVENDDDGNRIRRISLFEPDDDEIIFESENYLSISTWTPDGRYIGGSTRMEDSGSLDVWFWDVEGAEPPVALFRTNFNDVYPVISPDGRWVAYESDETGRSEIYVRSFPGTGRRWRISHEGGMRPFWTRDGTEIVYLSASRKMMATAIDYEGNELEPGETTELFTPGSLVYPRTPYVSPDGEQFIYPTIQSGSEQDVVTLIFNWHEGDG